MTTTGKHLIWSDYNKTLCERGNLFVWVCEDFLKALNDPQPKELRKLGRPVLYKDSLIELVLSIRYALGFPLRQVTGLCKSLLPRMGINICLPDYTTLCRRSKKLSLQMGLKQKGKPIHLALDATGLKVYGEGEWKVRQHGIGKRRTWLKVHFAVDIETFEIHCVGVTTNDIADGEVVEDLLKNTPNLGKTYGDGAYDTHESRKAIKTKGGLPIIPPREDAIQHPGKEVLLERNKALEDIETYKKEGLSHEEARKKWKKESGYHQRSKVETHMYRFKTTFGGTCQSRHFDNQANEIFMKTKLLNKLTARGMPKYLKAA
jgi:hypothetical protein